MTFAVLQRPGAHGLPEDTPEMGGAGKARLLRHRADAELRCLQQLLGGLDAAAIDVIHNGLPRYPSEQAAEVVGRDVKLCRHLAEGKLLLVIGGKVGADLLHGLVAGRAAWLSARYSCSA